MSRRNQMTWRYLWLVTIATGAWLTGPTGCSSNNSSGLPAGGNNPNVGGSSGTGGNNSGTGSGFNVGDSGTKTDAGPTIINTSFLTPAWQYYNTATEKGYLESGAPTSAKDLFSGAAATDDTVSILYPLNNSMMPSNMGYVTVQWSHTNTANLIYGKGNTMFRVIVTAGGIKYIFYAKECRDPACSIELPLSEWYQLGTTYKGSSVTMTVQGTDPTTAAAPVVSSAPITINFSPEPVRGQVYYWAAEARAIKRGAFGSKEPSPFIVPKSPTNAFECVACHSVSRNNKVIAFAVASESPSDLTNGSGENRSGIQSAPVANPSQPYFKPTMGTSPWPSPTVAGSIWNGYNNAPTNYTGHNVALTPDGSVMWVNGVVENAAGWPIYVEFRDAITGAALKRYTSDDLGGTLPIFPEWSPDGTQIVAALAAKGTCPQFWTSDTCNASIVVYAYSGSTLGTPRVLVQGTTSQFNYYPTWSADGKWIAFTASPASTTSQGYLRSMSGSDVHNTKQGVIYIVPSTGGPYTCPSSSCVELTNATGYSMTQAKAGAQTGTTWPKFTPFAQSGGNLLFLSYTSKRDYGYVLKNRAQIWISAIDMTKVAAGQDGSYPPIWIPFQEKSDGSITPYWAETPDCTDSGCGTCLSNEKCLVDRAQNICQCVVNGEVVN